jgi:hypothetical protein
MSLALKNYAQGTEFSLVSDDELFFVNGGSGSGSNGSSSSGENKNTDLPPVPAIIGSWVTTGPTVFKYGC